MNNLVYHVVVTALVTGLSSYAYAQAPPEAKAGRGQLLQKADTNGDGQVTLDEASKTFPKMTPERFRQLDRNGDGVLTKADHPRKGAQASTLSAAAAPGEHPRGGQFLKKADTDGNGKVTFEEAHAVAPKLTLERFNKRDANHDGVLTAEDQPVQHGPKSTEGAGVPVKKAENAPGSARAAQYAKLFQADSNQDGKVTYEEIVAKKPGFPREAFARLDRNGDGVLTEADRAVGPKNNLGQGEHAPGDLRQKIKAADTNGDGKTTYEEAVATHPKLTKEAFQRLDRNGDGVLTAEDSPKAP